MYENDKDLDQALFDAVNAEELETIQSLLYKRDSAIREII